MAIITAADLAAHLNIPDSDDDSSLQIAADAACQWAHEFCGTMRVFDKTSQGSETSRQFRADGSWLCYVDDFWDTTNLVVKTDDSQNGSFGTTWTINTDFILEPLNGKRSGQTWAYYKITATGNRYFPMPVYNRPMVQVTAAWGWSSVPTAVKQGTLYQAARFFKRRESPEGMLSGFGDYGSRVAQGDDPDAVRLLTPYIRGVDGYGIA